MIAPTTILDNWVTKATDVFRAFKEIQGNDTSTKTVIALGTWGSGIQATWTSFKQLVEKATEASFKADIVISISSTHMLHNITSCFAVPPAIINSNKDLYPSLAKYSELVKVSYQYRNSLIEVGLSLEFAANAYELKKEPAKIDDVQLYADCYTHSIASVSAACSKRTTFNRVIPQTTVLNIHEKAKNIVYMHENKETFMAKVNYIMNITRWPRFALLVYNVHMADITKGCGYGDPFYLLEDMKRALKS
ncbi:uncharacterized protein LOC119459458 isoform X1 [Dermacentor silvarum]|uniref:uncharacterized protein LOC119459458 isoform X1 n=1 Tax=Dermacentor silvarum TaxID=543639 RepID=UPI0021007021|nr:uncharacterized protein LOC119459458 isoform X1 [Dermacentor silvarum]